MRFKVGDRVEVLPIKEDFEDLLHLTHGLDVVGMIGNITNIRECVSYPITVMFITVYNGRVKGHFKEGELELANYREENW